MKEESKPEMDLSTEDKIKSAARKLFTQRGYDAVKTREIAAEAGINLALLNYYFRSKEKLFELVMLDNMSTFVQGAAAIIHNPATSLDEKIAQLVSHYVDVLSQNPDIPHFVMNQMRSHPEKIIQILGERLNVFNSALIRQLGEEIAKGKMVNLAHPVQFMVNLLALTIFPFMAMPILKGVGQINDDTFVTMMATRKALIPIWIKAMYKPLDTNRTDEHEAKQNL